MVGSAIAAGLHASLGIDHEAQALVIVNAEPSSHPGVRGARIRATGTIARSAQSAATARDFAVAAGSANVQSEKGIRNQIRVSADPASGLVRITTTGRSDSEAAALANGVAVQTASLARQLVLGDVGQGRLVVGDFEDGPGYWLLPALFNAPPTSARVTTAVAHDHRASFVVTCRGPLGCGPSTPMYHLFRAGVTYTATLWVRIRPVGFPVSAVFGSTPDDVTTTPPSAGGSGWRRLAIAWTPKRDASVAGVGIQTRARRSSRIWVDGVLEFDPTLARPGQRPVASLGQEAKVFASAGAIVVSPARITGTVSNDVAWWALAGAGIGLLAAAAAVLLGWFADRRRER